MNGSNLTQSQAANCFNETERLMVLPLRRHFPEQGSALTVNFLICKHLCGQRVGFNRQTFLQWYVFSTFTLLQCVFLIFSLLKKLISKNGNKIKYSEMSELLSILVRV